MAFQIIRNDITKVSADAIVNTANPKPVYGSGTDGAVYAAAGAERLLAERKKIGDIPVGQAAATPAVSLDARFIIHTVGPAWTDGLHGEREAVRSCYENSLRLAKELGCESIAFPLIATGVYGFPKDEALQIAVSVFSAFLSVSEMQITLVVFDEESFVLSGRLFSGVDAFIDTHYAEAKLEEEYGITPPAASAYECIPREAKDRESGKRGLFRRITDAFPGHLAAAGRTPAAVQPAKEPSPDEQAEDKAPQPLTSSYHAAIPDDNTVLTGAAKPGRSLEEVMSRVADTWQESLLQLIDEKGYTDTEVYKRANIDRKLFSKIRSNADYQPKKITAVAFALALRLSLDETKDLLSRAGYALSPSSRFDLIIEYFIAQEVYDTYTINLALFEHHQPLLGA